MKTIQAHFNSLLQPNIEYVNESLTLALRVDGIPGLLERRYHGEYPNSTFELFITMSTTSSME